jgi:hypothetical protein
MGRWLLLARDILATRPQAIGEVILLTDGRNESESPQELQRAVRACRDRLQCDCRGFGTDWELDELQQIASTLLGSVDIVTHPAALADHFRETAAVAMTKRVGRATLDVWMPRGVRVREFRQVSPTLETLTGRDVPVDRHTVRFGTGAWADEVRDYHLVLEVPPMIGGDTLLAARIAMAVDGRQLAEATVQVTGAFGVPTSDAVGDLVAYYRSHAELVNNIRMGLRARESGDDRGAAAALGRASELADRIGHHTTLELLRDVVVEDADTGALRFRRDATRAEELTLATRSVRTVRP